MSPIRPLDWQRESTVADPEDSAGEDDALLSYASVL